MKGVMHYYRNRLRCVGMGRVGFGVDNLGNGSIEDSLAMGSASHRGLLVRTACILVHTALDMRAESELIRIPRFGNAQG